MANEYALYKGEKLLAMGTAKEIAEQENIQTRTVYFYASPSYKRRVSKRVDGLGGNYMTVIKLN